MTRKEFIALVTAGAATRGLAQSTPPPLTAPQPAKPVVTAPKSSPPKALALPPVQAGPAYVRVGPMLGHVGPQDARLWIRATAAVPWSVQIGESAALEDAREIPGAALTPETAESGLAMLDGLQPATRYFYRVLVEGRPQQVAPLPSFVTAPAVGEKGRLRIAFSSCLGEAIFSAAPAWAELAARRDSGAKDGGFDLLLLLGDIHYANTTDPAKLRTYYAAHRLSAGCREMSAHVPTYALWDDHDYGPNNSDGTLVGKENSLRIFQEVWGNPACGEPENPGCYCTFQRGDVQFFMLDGRYHRSPNKAPDGPEKTMFGAAQLAWLKRELLASKAAIKVLANGSEWQSFGSDDSYSLFRTERDALFAWIDEQRIEGVMLLSGDRHFSAAYHVLGRFVELSSGPLGSGNARLRPNTERFAGHDEGRLWMVLDLDTTGAEPVVAYELWKAGAGLVERRALTWAQVQGREPIAHSPSTTEPKPAPAAPAPPTPPAPVKEPA